MLRILCLAAVLLLLGCSREPRAACELTLEDLATQTAHLAPGAERRIYVADQAARLVERARAAVVVRGAPTRVDAWLSARGRGRLALSADGCVVYQADVAAGELRRFLEGP